MPLKFPKIFVKYNNNHRTPMDTKTNNDQRAVAEFPLSVGGREVKKKASKKLPYNYEKKTTRRKKHNTNPTARVGQGWSGLGNTRRRASPIEAAACSETSWSFIYWRDFKRRKRKVIFFLHNISCFDGGLKKPLTAQLESSLLSLPLVYETPPADYSSTSVNWIEGDYDAFWITDSLDRWFAFDWGKFVLRKFALIAC